MKKIMKKVLSLALAVALAIAPMTVMAGSGTMSDPATLVVDGTANEVVLTEYQETYYYSYKPSVDGALTLTQNCGDVYVQIRGTGVYNNFDYNPANGYTTESVTVDLTAGNTYIISAMTSTFQAGTVSFYASFAAKGTSNNPATLVVDGTANEVVLTEYQETYYYSYKPSVDGALTLTQNCGDVYVQIQGTGVYNNFDYNPANGYTTESVTVDLTAGNTYIISAMTSTFQAGTVSFKATYEESTGGSSNIENGTTPETALPINAAYIELFEGKTTYYKISANAGTAYTIDLYSMTGASFDLYTYNPMIMNYIFNSSSANGLLSATVQATGNELIFGVYSASGIYVRVSVTEYVEGDEDDSTTGSSYDNPEIITELGAITQDTPSGETYWYQWTATNDGVFTVTTTTEGANAKIFNVNGEYDYVREELENGRSAMVKEGDVVVYYVNPSGLTSANITTSFEEGAVIEQNNGNSDEEEVNYGTGVALELGTKEYVADAAYTYTVYEFSPVETGKYTFSSTDSKIGIVSNNGMWITVGSSTTEIDPASVNETQVTWDCTGVGQSIWLAAMPDTNVATITVSRSELDTSDEVAWTIYKNTITPTTYKYDGDVNKLLETYVDTSDNVVDKAVLGKDGYYHLNSEDGEILYVNLNDALMSLATMATKGKVSAVYYDNNNEITEKIDFTTALLEYLGVKDIAELEALNLGTNPVIYPLTADLMTMFQKVGDRNGWYGEGGFIANTLADDAWMFATYYVKGQTTSSVPAPGVTSTSPSTGDHANVGVWAIVMVVAAGAAYVVAESKRRAR